VTTPPDSHLTYFGPHGVYTHMHILPGKSSGRRVNGKQELASLWRRLVLHYQGPHRRLLRWSSTRVLHLGRGIDAIHGCLFEGKICWNACQYFSLARSSVLGHMD
jgi:hypothetical protein